MEQRIGIVAGSGRYLVPAIASLKEQGHSPVIAAIQGEASPRIAGAGVVLEWFKAGEVTKILDFFARHGVNRILLLGKVRPTVIFRLDNFDRQSQDVLDRLPDASPLSLLRAAVGIFEQAGMRLLSPAAILRPHFCRPGVLTKAKPTREQLVDIDYGLELARRFADLDIGQTVVVKRRAVVAVEAMEGTNATIRRAGRLTGGGFCAVKAARSGQDIRLDVPAVGLDTMHALVRAGAGALGIDASTVAFFQREEALALADANRIAVVARRRPSTRKRTRWNV